MLTTVCCAWRWSLVARGLGVGVPLRAAVAAYYRSQFLNTTLPGGVLGDVHRGVRHGRDVGDVGRGLRAVAWERSAGQVVQIVLAVAVLLVLPSPVRSSMPLVAVRGRGGRARRRRSLSRALPGRGASRWARCAARRPRDIRDGLLARRAWPASCSPPPGRRRPRGDLPDRRAHRRRDRVARRRCCRWRCSCCSRWRCRNIAGWGPREGVAAWAFAAAGLGAAQGVATAVVYGVMVLVASLPGRRRAGRRVAAPVAAAGRPEPARPARGQAARALRRSRAWLTPVHPAELRHVDRRLPRRRDAARLLLSNDADFDRVDAVRAACDAILVGAATVRNDNPRLLVRSQTRRDERAGPRAARRRRSR